MLTDPHQRSNNIQSTSDLGQLSTRWRCFVFPDSHEQLIYTKDESKQQSVQWCRSSSPKPIKFEQCFHGTSTITIEKLRKLRGSKLSSSAILLHDNASPPHRCLDQEYSKNFVIICLTILFIVPTLYLATICSSCIWNSRLVDNGLKGW